LTYSILYDIDNTYTIKKKSKGDILMPKLNKETNGYEIIYDKTSERNILKIFDKDSLFPLLIKVHSLEPRELIITKNRKLHLT